MSTLSTTHEWKWLRRLTHKLQDSRQVLLLSFLFGAGANSFFFVFVDQPGYDHIANQLAAAVFWGLALLAPLQRGYTIICNLALLTGVALMSYIAACTGGINSPAMGWMTIMAVAALLLLGSNWARLWLGVILLISLVQFTGVVMGWISGEVNKSPSTVRWALLDIFNVVLSLILALTFYDWVQNRQMRELQERNDHVEDTQKALTLAQSHKDEFIASVGHELRTPMNAILGLNGVLLNELTDRPQDAEIASLIRDSTQQLLRLVNDILDFSQLEAGRLTLLEKPVLLEQSMRHVIHEFEERAKEKSLDLRLEIAPDLPAALLLDAQRLHQVLSNLLDNALKFTTQGHVLLRVLRVQDRLRFEVQDTGRGIAQDRQQDVFKRFEHADAQTTRAYGGTGLGLAICEKLISLQGGQIGVHSVPNQGALFWFELPVRPVVMAQLVLDQAHQTPAASAQLRFLLVDDNAVNQIVARLVINKSWPQASVTMANSGEQALALLEEQAFDMVLMDMIMPGIDGLETTRRLRAHPRPEVSQLIVIGLTANTTLRDRERCLAAGMNGVLSKPMDAQEVQTTINQLAHLYTGRRRPEASV